IAPVAKKTRETNQHDSASTTEKQAQSHTKAIPVDTNSAASKADFDQSALSITDDTNTATNVHTKRTVAQTPALVSINNEPIPYKRRRRQPTVIADNSSTDSKNNADNLLNVAAKPASDKEQVVNTAKYEKKAPKAASDFAEDTPSVTKKPVAKRAASNKPAATKQDTKKQTTQKQNTESQTAIIKSNDNKGPIPSKRRRRQ